MAIRTRPRRRRRIAAITRSASAEHKRPPISLLVLKSGTVMKSSANITTSALTSMECSVSGECAAFGTPMSSREAAQRESLLI